MSSSPRSMAVRDLGQYLASSLKKVVCRDVTEVVVCVLP